MDRQNSKLWYVYILRCKDGTLYCGATNDVAARIAAHDEGRGARYTRGRGPVRLVFKKRCISKSSALREEARIKRLTRAQKIALARHARKE